MPVRGLDGVTGQAVFLKEFSGTGTDADPFVMQRADPVAHTKLDTINSSINAQSNTWLFHSNAGTLASSTVKTGASRLRSGYIVNNSTTQTLYLQFFDLAAAPAAGSTALKVPAFVIFPGMVFGFGPNEFGGGGMPFTTGLTYGVSTAQDNFTAATASTIRLWIAYT